jgi:uncharacterized protein (DUF3084 family)
MKKAAYALAAALLIGWGLVSGLDAYHKHQGAHQEQWSHQQDQEAQSHANSAQQIQDHAADLAAAQADVDRARAEVARLRKILAAKPSVPVSDPADPNPPIVPAVAPDHRDETIAALDVLVRAQDAQIAGLKLALTDEQRRSGEWQAAYQHEQQARLAQEAATNAWKQSVKESRGRGRIEGFVAGIAMGYAGGKL